MNKNETRYFRTAEKMDVAMIKLLEKKDFEYITVKEICVAAGVNRSTFYLHYENTVDLLRETTQYITDGFLDYFEVDKSQLKFNYDSDPVEELIFITPQYVIPYLTYIKENQQVFKTSLKHFGAFGFEGVYKKMREHIFSPILDRFGVAEAEKEYILRFYLMGVTAIVMEWLNNGCSEDYETICKIISDCILGHRGISRHE